MIFLRNGYSKTKFNLKYFFYFALIWKIQAYYTLTYRSDWANESELTVFIIRGRWNVIPFELSILTPILTPILIPRFKAKSKYFSQQAHLKSAEVMFKAKKMSHCVI